jgi:hypothetical protein
MDSEDQNILISEEEIHERELILKCFQLMRDERSRYEDQAIRLIEAAKLETETEGFRLSYRVKENTYFCRINNKNKSGNNYKIEFPIPELEKDKIETLVELFAQSEAERIS